MKLFDIIKYAWADKLVVGCASLLAIVMSLVFLLSNKIAAAIVNKTVKHKFICGFSGNDLCVLLGITLIAFVILIVLASRCKQIEFARFADKIMTMRAMSIVLFSAWLPFLLVFYPAPSCYDTIAMMSNPIAYSIYHPIVYALFVSLLVKGSMLFTNSTDLGLFLFAILQMLFMAGAISYVIKWLFEKTKNKYLSYGLLLFFSLCPLIANYAISAVKDTPFNIILLLWVIFLYDICVEKKPIFGNNRGYFFAFISIALMLLRNNGYYIYIVLFAFLLIFIKMERKKILLLGSLFLIISLIPNFILGHFYGKKQLFQEKMAVPIQQVARTVTLNREIDANTLALITPYIKINDLRQIYNPFFADRIKWNKEKLNRGKFNKQPKDFIKAWKILAKDNKDIYLEAWALETYGYWGMKTQGWIFQSRFCYAAPYKGVIENGPSAINGNGLRTGNLPINNTVKNVLANYMYEYAGFINPGNCFWLMSLLCLIIIAKKEYGKLIPFLPLYLCWGTLTVAAPGAFIYRYAFMYPLCLPILAAITFIPSYSAAGAERNDENEKNSSVNTML